MERAMMQKFSKFVGSKLFFKLIIAFFVLQASWVALTASYSMAFDEYFHLGIIKVYSTKILPFLGTQVDGPAFYGALTRDPSYMFHYLMSFPYRFVAGLTDSLMVQIITLRLIDVALFAFGIYIMSRVLRLAGVSSLIANIILLFFVSIPVIPMVAGELNYDNMLFPVVALSLYFCLKITIFVRKNERLPTPQLLIGTAALLAFGSLVKYAFLPLALAIVLYILFTIKRHVGFRRISKVHARWKSIRAAYASKSLILLTILFVIMGGLWAERYGINMVTYHTPIPECNQVLTLTACSAYEPFARNQSFKTRNFAARRTDIAVARFPLTWLRLSVLSMMFALGPRYTHYAHANPLPIAYMTVWTVVLLGIVVTVANAKWLWRQHNGIQFFLVISVVYVGVLFLQNFSEFMNLGVPVAIQGRYLIPVLIPIMTIGAFSARRLLIRLTVKPRVMAAIIVLLVAFMFEGGGCRTLHHRVV